MAAVEVTKHRPSSAEIHSWSQSMLQSAAGGDAPNCSPSRRELDQIWSWNAVVQPAVQGCVHELIAETAQAQPEALAVCAWDGDFTYRQLNSLADVVARRLLGLGVIPKSSLPILFSKSRWTCVAMLGVIKAGCSVISLDATHPDTRLRSVVQQCRPMAVVSSAAHRSRASLLVDAPVLQLDDTMLDATALPEEDLPRLPTVSPSDIVYISFTSGTTGQPKGACISHANVRSTVHYQAQRLGFQRGSRVFDFAPYSFDVAWSNFLHTLCAGGCLCIAREQDMLNDLSSAITSFKATLINVTPTVLKTINPIPPTLESVLLSGEMPYQENLTQWAGHVRLLNTYGPTECTFKCAFSVVDSSQEGRPDIGNGVGFCTWIVDPDDSSRLASLGSVGELYLEGPMVGKGYLSDPEKTASAFVNDPPWLLAGSGGFPGRRGRLYKTGDLVKYKPDGRILFVGRNNSSQLKVRGQRVEIGDVEHHVRKCLPYHVSTIVDVVTPRGNDSPVLVLFVLVTSQNIDKVTASMDGLAEGLSQVLPGFMIPSIYFPVNEIPIAATGKADRRRLREIGNTLSWEEIVGLQSTILSTRQFIEPVTDTERQLRQVWANVLGLEATRISTAYSFLRLGGDSVAAMQVVAAARERDLSLTVADIFIAPVLGDLARVVERREVLDMEAIVPFSLVGASADETCLREDAARLCGVDLFDIEDIYPCTPLQQGLLAMTARNEPLSTRAHGNANGAASAYVSRTVFELPGSVNIERLSKAWVSTMMSSPIIRTRIIDIPGEGLVQAVICAPVPMRHYSHIGDVVANTQPMGLGTPLCQASIVQGDLCQFVLEMHHAIFDGWCRILLLDAVEAAYSETLATSPPLTPFQPFIKHVLAANSEAAASFWQTQLAGSEATIFPPQNYTPARKLDLDHSIGGLRWPRTGITPSAVIRSALAMLLSSYTNASDVKFGATVSGRQAPVPGIDRLAGPTIATVPVRVKFDWDQTVEALQQQIQRQAVELGEHEQFGLQRIRRISDDVDEASQFQLLLVVQPAQEGTSQNGVLFSQPMSIVADADGTISSSPALVPKDGRSDSMGIYNSYAMMIICQLEDSGLTLKINFDSGALEPEQAKRIALHLENLIRQLCSDQSAGSKKVRDITALCKEDLIDIWGWNRVVPEAAAEPVAQLIDSRAAMNPEHVAISAWDRQLTYQQLKDLSESLACQMREEGVGAGSIVMLSFAKSSWLIVSMMSVLKLGAIALPTSSRISPRRVSEMMENLRPNFVLTESVSDTSALNGLIPTLEISSLIQPGSGEHPQLLEAHDAYLQDPALILFTSGSTGTPKSILWSHGTLSSNVRAAASSFGITAESRVFQFADYEFDVSTVEALSTLSVGGCLCIPSESDRANRLAGAINDTRASWVCLTPSVSETLAPADVPSLRTLVLAGEKLEQTTASRWARAIDFVYNWYGPAEASVASSYSVEQETWRPGMIGRSTSGLTWLVDPKDPNALAPIGAIAELCIEGPTVASYVGNKGPELNEKALISPTWLRRGHNEIPGRHAHVYRTGDLVKYGPGGGLVFLGRVSDSQRKLRGRRVELGEIETRVQSFLSGKFDATVVAEIFVPLDGKSETLALFVSPLDAAHGEVDVVRRVSKDLPVDELEASLVKFLPSHMIPKIYIPLPTIPTSPSGKTDRHRLRQIGSSLTYELLAGMQPSRAEARKPCTDAELNMQQLWAEIIGIEAGAIYADDNFLRLGGDSISAMRLVASARNQGVALTVADVFEFPQLEKMAQVARQESRPPEQEYAPFSLLAANARGAQCRSHAAQLCAVPESQVVDIYPCTPLQEGLLALGVRRPGRYISRSVLGLQSNTDADRLQKAWLSTVERLAILRTRIVDIPEQGLMQVVVRDSHLRFGSDVDAYLREDERESMGLGTALCRAAIIDRNFIFTIHHCTYDGNSLKMILDELESQYLGNTGINVTPFRNFIHHLGKVDPQEAANFWKTQLSSSEKSRQFPVLPYSGYEAQANEHLGHSVSLEWPRTGITPSTIIRSAWAVLATKYTTSSDVIFGATVSGRQADMRGVENCAGPTNCTIPICVSVDWSETVQGFLTRIQRQAIQTTLYEQYGLQNIRRIDKHLDSDAITTLLVVQPVAEGKSLDKDSLLFKARSFSANISTEGTDPFNTYSMMLICELATSGLRLRMSFDNRVIDRRQVHHIACQFETIIRQLSLEHSPMVKLDDLQTASALDLDLFWTQNAKVPDEPNAFVHDLITLAAEKQLSGTAIDAWDGQFSYQEVEKLSNLLCQRLIGLGVEKGSVIALCFEKSKWTSVAQVAVLKAGAVILLQSIAVPDVRLGSVFKSLGVQLAVASESRVKVVSKYARCFTIDSLMQSSPESVPVSVPEMEMGDPAAILVSSGTTGEPKKILWSHGTVAANVKGHGQCVSLNASSRVFQFASYDFDVCTVETLSALVNMGCVCIPSEAERLDGMSAAINRLGANYINITPSTARLLRPEDVPGISTIVMSGENLVQEDVDKWKTKCRVINWYGPAEFSSATFCDAGKSTWRSGALGGMDSRHPGLCWLVDPRNYNNLSPYGAVGEVALEGPLCAIGYVGNMTTSEQRFLKNPIFLSLGQGRDKPGRHGRIYLTGDLAKYDTDGTLIYLGRKDTQLKIRGQLVAPEEVEHHITQCLADRKDSIQAIVDAVLPKNGGNLTLVAFLSPVSHDELESMTPGLHDKLKRVLPGHCIPSYYIPIRRIPTAPTGKRDRARLQEIAASFAPPRQEPGRGRREPSSTAERTLRDLWSLALGIEARTISATDSFLRVGDSIQAMRLVGMARQQGLLLTVADVFQNPTLEDMAHSLKNQDSAEHSVRPFTLLDPRQDVDLARHYAAVLCGVSRDDIEDLFPCTPLQEGLLALTTRRQGDYTGRNILKLAPSVDVARFKGAWEEVVAMFPILRTCIIDLQRQGLVQAVIQGRGCWTEAEDMVEYTRKENAAPMDLNSPLMRCGLFPADDGQTYIFALTMHHCIYDGLTTPLILEALESLYNRTTALRPCAFQSFVKYIDGVDKTAEVAFWKNQFEGLEAAQFPALPTSTYQPRTDSALVHRIEDIVWRTDDSTPTTLIRAAFALVCSQYTSSSDVVFGTVVSGRKAPVSGIERLAGPTIATVPIRVKVDGDGRIPDLIVALQRQATDMITHEQAGLSKISKVSEEAQQACQFQTLLVVQPPEQEMRDTSLFVSDARPGGLETQAHRYDGFNSYALSFICTLKQRSIIVEMCSDSAVIEQDTVRRLAQSFELTLRKLCSAELDDVPIRAIGMATDQDLDQIWQWNSEPTESVERCMHDLIMEVAKTQPDAVAISAWDGELTYMVLDQLSNTIAARLVKLGVGRNVIVPLVFEKSMFAPLALLSVVKAGGAGLLLDHSQPESRLKAILQPVRPLIILSSAANEAQCSRLLDKTFVLTRDSDLLRTSASEPSCVAEQLPRVHPSDLLYVVFTSGSTGTPKGCLVQHRHFSSAVTHQRNTLGFDKSTRMYDFTSYSFEPYWSVFHTLAAGGTLCIPSEEERKSSLTESLRKFRTTHVFLTPTVARLVDATMITTMRGLFLGGEEVTTDDVARWLPRVNVFNTYGPSECSAATVYHKVPNPIPSRLSIGTGLAASTWIVDTRSGEHLSPVGTVGELYLEGPLVGYAYLGDEEKTAASFVEAPSWLLKGSPDGRVPGRRGRLYKTGDLVKYNPIDGTLFFVGRRDTQVKLRGQRIELAEVDNHIRRCLADKLTSKSAVAEIIVPKVTGNPMLVVFLQAGPAEKTRVDEIVAELELKLPEQLPAYMIPGAYIPIESTPLMPSGKTDRKRLREMGANLTLQQLAGVGNLKSGKPLSTTSELHLQQLWATVLGVPENSIAADSSFIRLGGDSISAMRLAALARSQGVVLTVQNILNTPRLSGMASTMLSMQSNAASYREAVEPFSLLRNPDNKSKTLDHLSRHCKVGPEQIEDVFPCTGVQKSLLSMTAKADNAYVARFLLRLRDDVDLTRLKKAWEEVSQTTAPILRYRIVDVPTEGLMQVQLKTPMEWDACCSVKTYIERDRSMPMGLNTPLTRLAIIDDAHGGGRSCALTQHHAIYDGYSIDLLLTAVSNIYMELIDDSPVAPFQLFIKHVLATDQEEAAEFWRREFAQSEGVPFPTLPHQDYQPKADSTVRRDIADLKWPKQDATPSILIRATWSILNARYTDSNDVVFGAMVTGRQAPLAGIDRMVAPLINAVPVRVKVDPSQSVDDLLMKIQRQSVAMIPYEQTELLDIRRINTDTERGSRFNTLLVVQPVGHGNYKNYGNGPFQHVSDMASSRNGLDDFNPNAVMIICQLKETDGLGLEISFDSKVIDAAQMERVASLFEHILRQICTSSIRTVASIDTISARDVNEIWEWNASLPCAVRECVHDLIGNTAKRQPQEPAVCAWDGDLTYAQLDDFSSRLASCLVALGAGPGTTIPLCFEKSMWHPVAAVAVMKAGAACVTMDTTQPESRLRSIVDQLDAKLLVSSANNEALARRLSGADVVVLDQNHVMKLPRTSARTPCPRVRSSDVLYVVFTSGSTGVPKGVVTTHENFASAATHQEQILHIRRGTRVFDFVSYNFDVSWSNHLQTFIVGGCLCIPSEMERRDDIAGAFNRMKCDYSYFTPSVARSLDPSTLPGLRTLAMGGEPIPRSEAARWTRAETIIGIYGPAECAQALSFIRLNAQTPNNYVGFSFGAKTWLVEPGRPDRLAAIGSIGELLIEGPTVSRGYCGDPGRTAASYLQSPEWLLRGSPGHPGRHGTLYKTGDLLRYISDGSLQFIGRKDGMIKLRGQRIELEEVEYHVRAALDGPSLFSGIAAEIIIPQNSTSPILAVFLCLSERGKTKTRENTGFELVRLIDGLEERLSERVPQYMVPGAYIQVEKIPMTVTYKTDRRALRELGNTKTLEELAELQSRGKARRAPSTLMEKRLQALWSSVLGIEAANIGAESSFLRIGGESIAAMQLVAAARQQNLSLTVTDVFKAPRLSQLALRVKEVGSEEDLNLKAHPPLFFLEAYGPSAFLQNFVEPLLDSGVGAVKDVLPATDFQERAVLDALQDPPSRLPHWILELPDDADFVKLETACMKLVDYFDILHTVFVHAKGQCWQVLLSGFKPTFDYLDAKDENLTAFTNAVCAEDLKRPRKLGSSFVRFMAIGHCSGRRRLVIRLSHAQFDGFSWASVLQTLSSIYDDAAPLPPPQSTFGHYMAFTQLKKDQSLQYWTSRLHNSSFPHWSSSGQKGCTYTTGDRLTMELTTAMPNPRRHEGISPATMFHAACAVVLSRQFQQREVVFGRLVTGRSMLPTSLQNVVGPCMTEVPVRITIDADDTVAHVAVRLQKQFTQDAVYETSGMMQIIRNCTNWPDEAVDFGWRTSFQQEESSDFTFLGSPSNISFYERDLLPRMRPEIYATPKDGMLHLEFEGNRRLISDDTVREFLCRLGKALTED